MPRFNPYTVARPQAKVETREFIDPAAPDQPLELSLLACREAPYKFRIQSKIDEYITDYVHGRPSGKAQKPGEQAKRLPPIEVHYRGVGEGQAKQRIMIDEQTCKFVAVLETMQVPAEGEAPYNFAELVQMAVVIPDAFVEAGIWAFSLLNTAGDDAEAGDNAETGGDPVPNP